ncbi:TnsD family Tn7-like transposition protein [Qipengyuania sp.]|uniref:TnsD family Tn7-like transposition protein n=1 Tax=Qipengyuania sp. TaxID=2004515 RepID=UPI0037363540
MRGLVFFPPLLPGELLYSALARHGVLSGLTSPKGLMKDLYGRANMIATVDLPNNLSTLLGRLPSRRSAARHLIGGHTLYGYYTAFQSLELRQMAFEAMFGGEGSVHFLLGASVFRTGRPAYLQFCPDCAIQQEHDHGFRYWRVNHQLPGVLVCDRHDRRLRCSAVKLQASNRHAYVAASRLVCPDESEPVTDELRGRSRALATELASRCADLTARERPASNLQELRDGYRERLRDLGLVRGRHKVRQRELHSLFVDHFGELLDRMPGTRPVARCETWLNSIVRSAGGAHSPLHHILLEAFLDAMEGLPDERRAERIDAIGSQAVKASEPETGGSDIDWHAIDREYSIALRERAYRMERLSPPVRVTAASLEKQLNGRDWLAKRIEKLPISALAMSEIVESVGEFRARRMRWHVRNCLDRAEDDPWMVMRSAGLPPQYITQVRREFVLQARPRPRLARAI